MHNTATPESQISLFFSVHVAISEILSIIHFPIGYSKEISIFF